MIPKKRRCLIVAHALTGLMWTTAAAQTPPAGSQATAQGGRTLANNSISIQAPDTQAPTADVGSSDTAVGPDADRAVAEKPPVAIQETLPLGGSGGGIVRSETAASDELPKQADQEGVQADAGWFAGFDPSESELLRVGGALVAVLSLLWLMRLIVKRSGLVVNSAGRPSGVLEVLARYPVGRREHLVLLKMHRRILLVHQGDGRMSPLAQVDDPNEVAALLARVEQGSSGRQASRFNAMLDQFTNEHEQARGSTPRHLPRLRREPADDAHVVDLTRASSGMGLLRMKRSA